MMADDLDNVVLARLREIRAKQDEQSTQLGEIDRRLVALDKRVEDLHGLVVYSLGQSTETSFKQSRQDKRIDDVFEQLEKLLVEKQSS